jgi:hypothetical protein
MGPGVNGDRHGGVDLGEHPLGRLGLDASLFYTSLPTSGELLA